jgi:hypothetical protein
MPRSQEPAPEPTPEDFEDFVAAALKVDPKGLSGKHRKPKTRENNPKTP